MDTAWIGVPLPIGISGYYLPVHNVLTSSSSFSFGIVVTWTMSMGFKEISSGWIWKCKWENWIHEVTKHNVILQDNFWESDSESLPWDCLQLILSCNFSFENNYCHLINCWNICKIYQRVITVIFYVTTNFSCLFCLLYLINNIFLNKQWPYTCKWCFGLKMSPLTNSNYYKFSNITYILKVFCETGLWKIEK